MKSFIFISAFFWIQLSEAHCTRPILVPASPLGKMLTINNTTGEVAGIYPEIIRARATKHGCSFKFPIMPRARAEYQMSTGETDVLVGSIKVPSRDAWGGEFIPLHRSQWFLISFGDTNPPKSVQEILDHPKLILHAVRGFNYGVEYMEMLEKLERKNKLVYVSEPEKIVRMMSKDRSYYTFMPTVTFVGAMKNMDATKSLGSKVTYTRIKDLPEGIIGVYLSKKLTPQDKAELKSLFIAVRNEKIVFERLTHVFTAEEMMSNTPLKKEDL